MDVVLPVQVLLLDPERALHAAVFVHPVPERAGMGLKIVAGPGPPTLEFAFGLFMQVRAAVKCNLGSSFTKNGLQLDVSALKSDPGTMCKRRSRKAPPAKLWTGRKCAIKGLFGPSRSSY